MTFRKNIHEGIVSIYVECNDPEDVECNSGTPVEQDILRKYDLRPGDGVQHKILKTETLKLLEK